MENNKNDHNDNIIRPNTTNATTGTNSVVRPTDDVTKAHDTRRVQGDLDLTPFDLPYEDPAITNPEELASFPTPAEIMSKEDVENENDTHLIHTKKSPVREGRNIISTDNNPGRDGFM